MVTRRPPWDLLEEKDAEMVRLHDQVDQMAFSDGRLPGRIKLLMAMAIDAVLGAEGGVAVYARRAREAGPKFQNGVKSWAGFSTVPTSRLFREARARQDRAVG